MKKVICPILAAVALLLVGVQPGYAMDGSRGHAGVQARPETHERPEFPGHPNVRGRHEFSEHPGFRRHHETDVFVGPGFWWPPDWWGPGYPLSAESPVYAQPETQPQDYWYYCQNPQGYYPYVRQCPSGWQTVVPPPSPPAG